MNDQISILFFIEIFIRLIKVKVVCKWNQKFGII